MKTKWTFRWLAVFAATFSLALAMHASPPGLIHNWSAEGDATDSFGAANGVITNLDGSANQDVTFTTGQVGQAFSFDGNGYIDFGTNVAAFGTSNFAIAFWIQTTSTNVASLLNKVDGYYFGSGLITSLTACSAGYDSSTIIVTNEFTADDFGRGFAISLTDGFIRCAVRSGSGSIADDTNTADVTSLSRVNDGAFHHVVVDRYGTDLYVFIDGLISGKSSSTSVLDLPEAPYVVTNQVPLLATNAIQVNGEDGTPVYVPEVDSVSEPVSCLAGAGRIGHVVITRRINAFTGALDSIESTTTVTNGAPFTGVLDEIQIYGRALTAYEIYSITHPGIDLAIIDQPLNQRGLAGRRVLFHTLVVGKDPITYQWQFNGSDIPGAISNNLVLDLPRVIDSGSYSVFVSNPYSNLTSRVATLVITNLATPTDGLVARWSGEGTAADSVGGHDGVTSNIKYVPGVLGTCFQFNGTSSIHCGNVLGNIGDFTVDFWMQTTASADPYDGNGGIPLVAQRPYCSAVDCFSFRMFRSGSDFDYMTVDLGDYRNGFNPAQNLAGVSSALTSFHLNDGVFHHVAATRSSNVLSLYIDGTFVSATPTHDPCVLDSAGSFDMGVNACSASYGKVFKGCLDEVEVFNRALSDSEIYNTYSPNPGLKILRQPSTTSAAENSPASLTVSAAGTDPIAYQWQLNGGDIAGATTSIYSLASAQLTDAGIYTVNISNPVTTILSVPVGLTVVPASSILPGLINRWSAEGNYIDSMGNSTWGVGSSSFAPGVSGEAWKFDGVNSIICPDFNTGQFGYNDFTWALWIRYEKNGTLFSRMPAYRFAATGGMIQVQFGDGSRDFSGDWFIMGDANAGSWSATAPVPINDGQFHHVAIVRQDTTNLLIYIDGTNALQTVMPVFNLDAEWACAFCDDWGRYPRFAGEIDEAEDYNRALTSDEISSLYAKYAHGPRADFALQNITVAMGGSFTLNAGSVSSPGPVTYQWTLNGVPISGATDSTYTVESVDSAGIYAVTMTTPDGTISSPMARVSIQLSPGQYNGLFYYDGDVTDDASGFITLTLDINQTFSANIRQKNSTYRFTGKFIGTTATVQVKRGTLAPLTVTLSGVNGNKITGVVHDATHDVPLQANRAVYSAANPTPQAGSYTLELIGLSSPKAPNGHGFGNVTITPSGSINFIANLADDITVSQGASVANAGIWPLYIPAYGGKGSVLGWLSFTNSSASKCVGNLRWVKAPTPSSKNYKAGFATRIPVIGSTFTRAAAGLGISLNNSSVVLDAAKIYNPLNNPVTATNRNTITFAQTGARAQQLVVTPNFGRFTGKFFNPVTRKNTTVRGIVLQNQGYAAGYFLGSDNLSGRVTLQNN